MIIDGRTIVEIVSFDIFDTLLLRMVAKPSQFFSLVEKYAKNNRIAIPDNFANLRIQAERNIAQKNPYANIFDIYKEILEFRTEEERQNILQLEFEAELEVCVANKAMVKLFNNYKVEGIPVILITDMYWTKEYIIRILSNIGITGYEKLYISCECKANKYDGSLFSYVLKDLGIKPYNMMHYGDNRKSDIVQARLKGIHSKNAYYDLPELRAIYSDYKGLDNSSKSDYEIQQKMILCSIDKTKSRAYQLGYALLGPLLDGYTAWLKRQLEADGIENVLFLARDGLIMKKAFEVTNDDFNSIYVYASRRALIVPSIWKYDKLENVINLFFTSRNDTYGSLLQKMGLSEGEYLSVLKKHEINQAEKVNVKNIGLTKFPIIFEELKSRIVENSKKQDDLLARYVKTIDFNKKTAIVDIGWYGNMQRALQNNLKAYGKNGDVIGYYVGVVPDSKTVLDSGIMVKGYLFEPGNDALFEVEKSMNGLVEWFFSAEHGSTLGYCEQEDGGIAPVLDKCEFDNDFMKIEDELYIHKEFQEGALDYVKKISQYTFLNCIKKTPAVVFRNLQCFGMNPLTEDLKMIGNVRVIREAGNIQYFAKPKGVFQYIFHPKEIIEDIDNCGWRIGFIKRLLKIPFPYGKAYFMLRKFAKRIL